MARKPKQPKTVATLKHKEAKRTNIPSAEYQSVIEKELAAPVKVAYERGARGLKEEKESRNTDLDPQLVWRGKDAQDWSDLVVNAPPLYIQEKVSPKTIIDDLRRVASENWRVDNEAGANHSPLSPHHSNRPAQVDLFGDFNGLPDDADRTDFYRYQGNWQNRMILGDSLQVMASLAEREGLAGRVQCIYLDPPYGIKFNSNFQWSTTSRDVKDGKADHITREPEQVKAFRDTWRDGIHSYLTYLRDRLTVARDLLTESGSIFVQIGDENMHRVRAVMDEVFGDTNFVANIYFRKTGSHSDDNVGAALDTVLWYSRRLEQLKFRKLARVDDLPPIDEKYYVNVLLPDGSRRRMTGDERLRKMALPADAEVFRYGPITGQGPSDGDKDIDFRGVVYPKKSKRHWSTSNDGMARVAKTGRLLTIGNDLAFDLRWKEVPKNIGNVWEDTQSGGFGAEKVYVVETTSTVIERCVLMSIDPGDLVLDPTCGSGTTAYVAEQWGRRWITIDTSRVALALARARLMGARYPYYLLADSKEGRKKQWEMASGQWSAEAPEPLTPSYGDIRQGFVYQRVPHITLKSIANNTEIDVIWERWQGEIAALLARLSAVVGEEWIVDSRKDKHYDVELPAVLQEWEVPHEPPKSWPLSTHPLVTAFWQARIARQKEIDASIAAKADHEYLYDKPYEDKRKVRVAGPFTVESLIPHRVLGVDEDGNVIDSTKDGTGDERDFTRMILENLRTSGVQQAHKDGRIPVLKARMNAELHMADDLKNTGKGNLFVIFGEPDVTVASEEWLVDSSGERIAPYEIYKLVSGLDSLEQINGSDRKRVRDYARVSNRREVWNYIANAPSGSLDSGEHSRVPGAKDHGGVSSVAWLCAGLAGGAGNVPELVREITLSQSDGIRELVERLRRDQQNAQRFDQVTIHSPLTTNHYVQVRVNGVDIFKPQTGEVVSDGPDGIACWFVDTDYNQESYFVRQAYFLGATDPYKSLKTTLKAEINPEAWQTLHSDTSRPFPKPATGRIAVKVINHLGDEVMKVFRV